MSSVTDFFLSLLPSWSKRYRGAARTLAANAFLKDTLSLLETQPRGLSNLWPSGFQSAELNLLINETCNFLRQSIVPFVSHAAGRATPASRPTAHVTCIGSRLAADPPLGLLVGSFVGVCCRLGELLPCERCSSGIALRMCTYPKGNSPCPAASSILVSSPLAGGVPACHVAAIAEGSSSARLDTIAIGCFNPGRCGFCGLHSNHLLWWRLWATADEARSRSLSILILPSPRIPPGTHLPEGFPYLFIGPQTLQWDSVGIFVAPEISRRIVPLEEVGSARRLWLSVWPDGGATPWLLCAIAAPPGGDVTFWSELLTERRMLTAQRTYQHVVIAGDANTHLPYLVQHPPSCSCSHCKPSSTDKQITTLLRDSGLMAFNPVDAATHASGTIIDLVLSDESCPIYNLQVLPPHSVARSDHGFLSFYLPLTIAVSYEEGFGRVAWASSSDWDDIIGAINEPLLQLAKLTEALADNEVLASWVVSLAQPRRRRALLDAVVWLRNCWYCIAGHLAGAVTFSNRPRRHTTADLLPNAAKRATDDPDSLVAEAVHDHGRASLAIFQRLRQSNPGAADRFLSHMLKPREPLSLLLLDEDGTPMDRTHHLHAIQADLQRRAAAHATGTLTASMREYVSALRQNGATSCPVSHVCHCADRVTFTTDDLVATLAGINRNSRTINGSYAAVLAPHAGGRRLSLALANLVMRSCLLPTSWTMREFNPLRKKGPKAVQRLDYLRPISFASEMTAVFDSLFYNRYVEKVRSFWGSSQTGSVSEALASVLGVVLLCQCRQIAGLPIYLVFGDLSFAFDCVSKDGMRVAAFLAGIAGPAWYVIDDLLASDHARVHLNGLVSHSFHLQEGTAQGRKISILLFNGPMRFLHDAVATAHDGVTTAGYHMVTSQYIDDVVSPAASLSECRNVLSGFEKFTSEHGPRFNVGPSKTAVLPIDIEVAPALHHHLRYFDIPVPVVESYKYLGVLLDKHLHFNPALQRILAIGYDAIETFVGASNSVALPLPFQACYVPSRVASQVLYGIEFCIGVVGAETSLNRLQAHWAKCILGIQSFREGAWQVVSVECGWPRRLGTEMLLRAIMLKARCHLLPQSHPARVLCSLPTSSAQPAWLRHVAQTRTRRDFMVVIPDICDIFTTEQLDIASSTKSSRQRLLRNYRDLHVLPVLREYDSCAYAQVANNSRWPYATVQPHLDALPVDILQLPWASGTWKHYKTWACVRALGRWPLALFGVGDLPRILEKCPLCGRLDVDVRHVLQFCPATMHLFSCWALAAGHTPSTRHELCWTSLRLDLFGGRLGYLEFNPTLAQARIHFVGSVFSTAATALLHESTQAPDPIDELLAWAEATAT